MANKKMTIFDKILGRTRVQISEDERAIHLWKGQVQGILRSGEHMLSSRKDRLTLETHNLARAEVGTAYEKAIFEKLPDAAQEHFTVVQTGRTEVAIVERDGALYAVIGPDRRIVLWKDAGPWTTTVIDVADSPQVDARLLRRMGMTGKILHATVIAVGDGQTAMLFFDGEYQRRLDAGVHGFWSAGRAITHKLIDLKRQTIDVTGQEVLTHDRVTIRVNIAAQYQVTDPVKAVTEVKDFADALYRALQVAFRKTLGAMTLDQVLEQKVSVDTEAAKTVTDEMAAIGIKVGEIALKDVILPGEMREILNQVVSAQKEAEANVIRRREETNATRSLLNTAKVMADNPVMLRLKELEALETIADRVERITVHSGTEGLLNDLVKLRD